MVNLVLVSDNRPNRVQPYKSWKGKNDGINKTYTTNSAVPTNSRPVSGAQPRTTGKANPIKHWRKQLIPTAGSNSSRVGVSQIIDRPGGSVHLVTKDTYNQEPPCLSLVKNYITNNDTKSTDTNTCSKTVCNKQRITRSASTIVDKKYYQTTAEYLRSRVKLHKQKQTIAPIPTIKYYDDSTTPPTFIQPSDSKMGSQVYVSTSINDILGCNMVSFNNHRCVVYKPNNHKYSQQGAVSSSQRLANLKYNTIETSAKNLETPWGKAAASATRYRGVSNASCFNKDKFDLPIQQKHYRTIDGRQPAGGTGHHLSCCSQELVNIRNKSGSILSSTQGAGTGKYMPRPTPYVCHSLTKCNSVIKVL